MKDESLVKLTLEKLYERFVEARRREMELVRELGLIEADERSVSDRIEELHLAASVINESIDKNEWQRAHTKRRAVQWERRKLDGELEAIRIEVDTIERVIKWRELSSKTS